MLLPKPPRREPKPRKRIARGKAPKRGKRPARKSKRPRRKLMAYADSLWSQIVRRPGQCVICGQRERLQAAHGFSRRYHATRHDLRNGFCLCSGCHVYYTHRPLEWDDWLRCTWGVNLYDELRIKALLNQRNDLDSTVKALEAVLHSGAAVPEGA